MSDSCPQFGHKHIPSFQPTPQRQPAILPHSIWMSLTCTLSNLEENHIRFNGSILSSIFDYACLHTRQSRFKPVPNNNNDLSANFFRPGQDNYRSAHRAPHTHTHPSLKKGPKGPLNIRSLAWQVMLNICTLCWPCTRRIHIIPVRLNCTAAMENQPRRAKRPVPIPWLTGADIFYGLPSLH